MCMIVMPLMGTKPMKYNSSLAKTKKGTISERNWRKLHGSDDNGWSSFKFLTGPTLHTLLLNVMYLTQHEFRNGFLQSCGRK